MQQYLELLQYIRDNGTITHDRTGTGTLSVFGPTLKFDLTSGFPVSTTKRVHLKSIIAELLWFLNGGTNISYLHKLGVTIWDEWADENGDLGPVYGKQWRSWQSSHGEIDQVQILLDEIRRNPNSRRLIVSAWNPGDLKQMALPPCHMMWQVYVRNNKLSLQMYQRSADMFLGVPFNIASYALLTMMLAQVTNYKPSELHITFGDAHIYLNHIDQVNEQLSRAPRGLPRMEIRNRGQNLFSFKPNDFTLVGYNPWPAIRAPVSV